MGQVVQKQVRVGLRRKGRGILGVQVQVELPVLLGEAVPRTAQEPHGGRVGQAEPPVEQKQALHEVGAAHLLAQIQRGGQAQVRAAGVAGKGQAVAVDAPGLPRLVQVRGHRRRLAHGGGVLRLRGQPVIHGHHRHAGALRQDAADAVVGVQVAEGATAPAIVYSV